MYHEQARMARAKVVCSGNFPAGEMKGRVPCTHPVYKQSIFYFPPRSHLACRICHLSCAMFCYAGNLKAKLRSAKDFLLPSDRRQVGSKRLTSFVTTVRV